MVWFYEPGGGQGTILGIIGVQYPSTSFASASPLLYVGINGSLYSADWNGGGWNVLTPNALTPGWHMAVYEEWYSGSTYYLALYLDGQFVAQSSSSSLPQLFGSNGPFPYNDIGTAEVGGGYPGTPYSGTSNYGWWFFNGTIAYVALYNTILNQTQVQQLYQAGFPNTLFSNNLVISYILDPTYYNNNSYYFIPYYVNTQLMNQMGINNYNATSITPSGNTGPIPSSQFIYCLLYTSDAADE